MTSWHDRERDDAGLRAYIAGRIGQTAVELAALKVEHEHARAVIAAQQQKLAALEQAQAPATRPGGRRRGA